MTDTPNAQPDTEPTEAPADPTAGVEAQPADTDAAADDNAETTEATMASREAAKYRRRLRETEAERDKLVERLAALQRGEAERIAAQHLTDGADIWRDGATVDSLLGEDGGIDAAKVAEVVKATAAAHPHWIRSGAQKKIARGSLLSGASNTGDQMTPSWSRLLRDDRRGR